jgi:hypothetical protein
MHLKTARATYVRGAFVPVDFWGKFSTSTHILSARLGDLNCIKRLELYI